MCKNILLSLAMIVATSLSQASFAADTAKDECHIDMDCKNGQVCILALTPHVCKAPQAAGEACKRDKVCASRECDIPAGKEVGACK